MQRLATLSVAVTVLVSGLVGCSTGTEPEAKSAATPEPSTPAATGSFQAASAVLQKSCVGCHSGAGAKEGVQLSSHEEIMKGGQMGVIVVAGDVQNSLLAKAMRGRDGVDQMPPMGALDEASIKAVEDWIAAGAKPE